MVNKLSLTKTRSKWDKGQNKFGFTQAKSTLKAIKK